MAPKKRVEGHGPWAPGDDQQHGRPQKGGARWSVVELQLFSIAIYTWA